MAVTILSMLWKMANSCNFLLVVVVVVVEEEEEEAVMTFQVCFL